jgi:hypothetical protein
MEQPSHRSIIRISRFRERQKFLIADLGRAVEETIPAQRSAEGSTTLIDDARQELYTAKLLLSAAWFGDEE